MTRLLRVGSSAVLVGLSVGLLTTWTSLAHADDVPYDDPTAQGAITLCDANLDPISAGSVDDAPFVWRAVGGEEAPAPYNNQKRLAGLYYFQPQEGVDPGLWPGMKLTAESTYTNPDHPIAQATPIDLSLKSFVEGFPPRWDGYVQLRMYYSTYGAPISTEYATADIQVEGDNWSLISGGDAECDSGDAQSVEELLPNFKKSVKAVQQDSGDTENPEGDSDRGASTDDQQPNSVAQATGSESGAPSSATRWLPFALLAAIAAVLGGIGWLAWRAQRR